MASPRPARRNGAKAAIRDMRVSKKCGKARDLALDGLDDARLLVAGVDAP